MTAAIGLFFARVSVDLEAKLSPMADRIETAYLSTFGRQTSAGDATAWPPVIAGLTPGERAELTLNPFDDAVLVEAYERGSDNLDTERFLTEGILLQNPRNRVASRAALDLYNSSYQFQKLLREIDRLANLGAIDIYVAANIADQVAAIPFSSEDLSARLLQFPLWGPEAVSRIVFRRDERILGLYEDVISQYVETELNNVNGSPLLVNYAIRLMQFGKSEEAFAFWSTFNKSDIQDRSEGLLRNPRFSEPFMQGPFGWYAPNYIVQIDKPRSFIFEGIVSAEDGQRRSALRQYALLPQLDQDGLFSLHVEHGAQRGSRSVEYEVQVRCVNSSSVIQSYRVKRNVNANYQSEPFKIDCSTVLVDVLSNLQAVSKGGSFKFDAINIVPVSNVE